MKAFTYERVNTPAEAALSAQRVPGAKFIAGGTNLLDLMKLEIETPTHLIDVNGLGLDKIEVTDAGGLRIGALVWNTDTAAHERVRRDYAVLSAPCSLARLVSYVIRQPPQVICSSARAAPIFTTPISPAISACPGAAARHLKALAVSTRW
ncbi:hypothetical protein ECZU20_28270 [Escherichia coli]|nr:hypothetical protein ECZU20_28270 [Escherichia coli]